MAGTVLQNLQFTSAVEISAPNVTIKNCSFNFPNVPLGQGDYFGVWIHTGADNFMMQNCSLTGGGPGFEQICQDANNGQYLNLNVYDTPTTVFYLGGSATISGCWLHQIGWNGLGIKSNPSKANFNGLDHVDDIFFDNRRVPESHRTTTSIREATRRSPTACRTAYRTWRSIRYLMRKTT